MAVRVNSTVPIKVPLASDHHHLMALRVSSSQAPPSHATEFDILKHTHRFLRDEDEAPATWNEQLAAKYYASLFREFAVCDLKHYKSGNVCHAFHTAHSYN